MESKLIDLEQLFAALEPIYGHKKVSRWRERKSAVHLALMQGDFLKQSLTGAK